MDLTTQILLKNAVQHIQAKELNIAKELLIKAENLSPNEPEVWRLLSIIAVMRFDFDVALELIDRVIISMPDHGIAHSNRGNILKELHRYDEALDCYDRAIALQPNYAEAYSNKGNALQQLHRYDESLDCYDRAIALQPNYAEAYSNKGYALELRGQYLEAMDCYDRAIVINPEYADAYWNKAISQLASGDYEMGWKNYEARWFKSLPLKFRFNTIPRLEGLGNVCSKKVLVWSEQGFGDTFQFCRYIRPLADLGCEVTFVVPTSLLKVLSTLGSYCHLTDFVDCTTQEFDYQSPLLSLPLIFETSIQTIPSAIPYLSFDEKKKKEFQSKLSKDRNLKVGVVWNGGFRTDHPELWATNRRRNIALEQIAKIGDIPNVHFYSLQKGDPAESELIEKQNLLWPHIINCLEWLDDFSDTAALIENLDLVISVDTSTAHLAGALGKSVWILNRFDSCWRWLRGRSDCPWYPTAKLYQQSTFGDWEGVIERVRSDLSALAIEHLKIRQ